MSRVSDISTTEITLDEKDVVSTVAAAARSLDLRGKRVLLIVPDDTRTCPIGLMIRAIGKEFGPLVKSLDVMIALGTHRPMPLERIYRFLDIDEDFHASHLPKTRFMNHAWDDPAQLRSIGVISAETMRELSGGFLADEIDVKINSAVVRLRPSHRRRADLSARGRRILRRQQVLLPGHRRRGNHRRLPLARGPDHQPRDHRHPPNSRRAIVDHCAAMIGVPRHCFSLVVSKQGLHGLYFGTPEEAYNQAARRSAEVNVRWMPRSYHTVISVCPPMYPELWTAGKCMYKLEPVVEPGGRLIIHGPHIAEVSKSHGRWIEEVGYHVLPYFTEQFERFRHVPRGVLAHSTHVKGRGRFEAGIETPDVDVILATAIPREDCQRINLGYIDPDSIDLDDYRGREDEGILVVEKAGEVLHRLESERR